MDNILDRFLYPLFSDTLTVFKHGNDDDNSFIRKTLKEDLLNYMIYCVGYPEFEAENMLVQDIMNRGSEALQELRAWLIYWYSKWLGRTQIITSKQYGDMTTRLSKYAEHSVTIDISPTLMYELEKISRETLIENKEYACVNIMAKDIVFYGLRHEYKNLREVNSVPEQIRLMTVIIRRTKEIAATTGKLVFIRARN